MKYKTGDRFKNEFGYGVWEFLYKKSGDKYWCKCISIDTKSNPYNNKVGDITYWALNNTTAWEYLGNFSKSSNFEELYNLFNE